MQGLREVIERLRTASYHVEEVRIDPIDRISKDGDEFGLRDVASDFSGQDSPIVGAFRQPSCLVQAVIENSEGAVSQLPLFVEEVHNVLPGLLIPQDHYRLTPHTQFFINDFMKYCAKGVKTSRPRNTKASSRRESSNPS